MILDLTVDIGGTGYGRWSYGGVGKTISFLCVDLRTLAPTIDFTSYFTAPAPSPSSAPSPATAASLRRRPLQHCRRPLTGIFGTRRRRNPYLLPVPVVVVHCLIVLIVTVVILQTRIQIEIVARIGA
ncbi:hypothetical protein LXL04_035596 [Taraxacum kok-saghyz]